MTVGDWIASLALAISIASGLGSYLAWRETKHRYEFVAQWVLDCIRQMQTLYLLVEAGCKSSQQQVSDDEITRLRREISILVEQGRLFFRNSPGEKDLKGWGEEKPPAYQGIRPLLLDYLVCGCQVASQWQGADQSRRRELMAIALEAERQFLSLAQHEVGRARTISKKLSARGHSEPIDWIFVELRKRERAFGREMIR